MEIKIITFAKKHGREPGSIGSSVLRGQWLINNWPEASLWTEGAKSDVLIFQKVYWKEMMKCYPGIKILDMCDPDWMSGDVEVREISKLVDAITCSSKGLYDYLSKISLAPVYMIPDRIDLSVIDIRKEHVGRAQRVVWFGYYHNLKAAVPQVLPSLKRLGLKLLLISNDAYDPLQNYGLEIENRRFTWRTIKYDMTHGDIVINPQPATSPRFKFKSTNKTLMAWALGMPVADTAEDLERFLDPDERKKEAEAKLAEVREKWDIKISVEEFKKVIEDVKTKRENKF